MKSILTVLMVCLTTFLVSCSSDPEIVVLPPEGKSRILPQETSPVLYRSTDIKYLRTGEVVKEIQYNRYVDPNDRTIMYDNGSLYRVEQSSTWDLTPSHPKVDALNGVSTRTYPSEKEYYNLEETANNLASRTKVTDLRKRDVLLKSKEMILKAKEKQVEKHIKVSEEMIQALKTQEATIKRLNADNEFLRQQVLKFMKREEELKSRTRR